MSLRGYRPKTRKAPWTLAKPKDAPKPVKWTSRQSDRMKREKPIYLMRSRAFLKAERKAGKRCPVVTAIESLRNGFKYGHPISDRITECHHRAGRQGKLFLAEQFWMGVSRIGHRFIHSNIEVARKHGWIVPKGQWNNYQKALLALSSNGNT